MKLIFLGTRGNIEYRSKRHRMHSSLLVVYYTQRIMIDCGEDWTGKIKQKSLDAIFITHAHPDHAGGLVEGAPCAVYATNESWKLIEDYSIKERKTIDVRKTLSLHRLSVEAFPVVHSTRAPAVGFRIAAGRRTIFYAPDIVYIKEQVAALTGVDVYIGDGATMERSMVRRVKGRLIGHTPVSTQLTWCQKENVPRALFTHCGSGIVQGDERVLGTQVRALGRTRDVQAAIAYDSMKVILR